MAQPANTEASLSLSNLTISFMNRPSDLSLAAGKGIEGEERDKTEGQRQGQKRGTKERDNARKRDKWRDTETHTEEGNTHTVREHVSYHVSFI